MMLLVLQSHYRSVKRSLNPRNLNLAFLVVVSALFPVQSNSQVVDVTAELFRLRCEQLLPMIRENDPGPKWTQFEPIPFEDVLEAVEFDGVVVPFFALEDYQRVDHPYPARAWYLRTDESAVQMFETMDVSNSTVIGQEYVDAGLVDAPLDAWDINRRRYGSDIEGINCSEDLTNESPRAIFSRYLDLVIHFGSIPMGEAVIDVGKEDDYIIVGKNLFSHYVFTDDRKVYAYTFTLENEDLTPFLGRYIWALENDQVRIEENEHIVAAFRHEFTPEEKREGAQRTNRILESLLSNVLENETN